MPLVPADAPWPLVVLFAVAGALHLVVPRSYERMLPPRLPAPRALVLISGAAELAGAAGLVVPSLRAAAGWGLLVLLVAMFPANVQVLRDARARRARGWVQALLWARLPVQPLLMWWVWRAAIAPS